MAKVLILFAHPALEKSRVNKKLISNVSKIENVTFHDLYEEYPDFFIHIKREQKLLTEHDIIILHHPMFWFSTPPLLKQWEDLVLEHGWAYGSKGNALAGKKLLQVITTGGSSQAYKKNSFNRFTVREFLVPIEQSTVLCGMSYLPPLLIQGTHKFKNDEIEKSKNIYHQFLVNLTNNKIDFNTLQRFETVNEFLENNT